MEKPEKAVSYTRTEHGMQVVLKRRPTAWGRFVRLSVGQDLPSLRVLPLALAAGFALANLLGGLWGLAALLLVFITSYLAVVRADVGEDHVVRVVRDQVEVVVEGATVWSAPLHRFATRVHRDVLSLENGDGVFEIQTEHRPEELSFACARLTELQEQHGSPQQVPAALKRVRVTE